MITVVTDADGNWGIDGIPSGDYVVSVDETTVPDGLVASTPADVDATVPPGGTTSVDNGFVPAASIGDRVWHDTDRDGIQDPGEPGVAGVTVTLFGSDGR